MAKQKINALQNGGWWEELGRTTLGSAGDLITVNFTAKKYLKILITVTASGDVQNSTARFNNDSGTNYATTYNVGLTGTSGVYASQTSFPIESVQTDNGGRMSAYIDIVGNIAANEKNFEWTGLSQDAAGAATQITQLHGFGKWANTSSQINRFDLIQDAAGSYGIGSEVIVLGHD